MADVGNLKTRISLDSAQFEQSMAGVNRQLKGLKQEQKAVTSSGTGFARGVDELRGKSDVLTRTLKVQDAQVKELKRRYEESRKATGDNSKETQNANEKYQKAVAEMNKTENALKGITAEIERQSNPWKKLGDDMEAAGTKMQTIGKGMSDFGKSYSMRVTAPIVAGGAAMFKASMDYESAFAGVRKTVDATEEEFKTLSDGIRDMTKVLPASATEIASVGEAAGQLGIKTENILEFTRTMIDLGEATNMTSETAATEFARFANIVGMSQKDFDKLGSVVVDLGNNLATTEGEIVSMAMRLAGAGAQVGLTEAEIMSFAGALSSVGIEADAGGSAFSKVMVNMQLAAELGGDKLKDFAKVAGMSSKEFKQAFEQDAAGAMISFIKGLETAEDRGMSAIAVLDEMGITEVRMRDALLRAAGASDVFSDSIEMGSKAWEENTALTEEAEQRYATTESQLKIMWNRIKDVAITLGDALVPAVMDAIDAAEPLIQKIEEGAQAFADMDEEQQQTILKMIALAAAVGPVAIGVGGITTSIGGLLKVGGSLSTMIGTTGGAGLAGKVGLLGAGSAMPVGLAIAGVGALAGGAYYLYQNMNQLHDISTETADAMMDQYQANIPLIESFDELRQKSFLTNDEFARYLDLQSMLESESDPDAITAIKDEMEELQGKSKLSNDELNEMIGYNNTLTETIPEATTEITEQGNRVADTTDKLKDYNQEIANMAKRELESELQKSLANEVELREQIKEAQVTLNGLEEYEIGLRDIVKAHSDGTLDNLKEQLLTEKEILEEAYRVARNRGEVTDELSLQIESNEALLDLADRDIDKAREALGIAIDNTNEQRDTVAEKEADLNKTGEIVAKMVEYELIAAGINEETAKQAVKDAEVSGLLEDQLTALKNQKDELYAQTDPALQLNDSFIDSIDAIDEQISGLKTAKGNIQDLIGEAGEYNKELAKDIDKTINAKSNPTIDRFNYLLSMPLTRQVTIRQTGGMHYPTNFTGTDYHPGGPSWLGEKGPELVRVGNKWSIEDFGLYDLPRGAEVFTHEESKKMIRAVNNIPGYASGISPSGEANRVIGQLNNPTSDTESTTLLREQNNILLQLLKKENIAYVEFETVYQPVKKRLAEDEYSNNKRRR